MENNQHRVLIFTGGRLGSWALDGIKPQDYLIGADRGALFLVNQGLQPDAAIGDFDSVTKEEQELIRINSGHFFSCDPLDKDYTDTELAFDHAAKLHPSEIVLLGALGTRFDHSLANVHLLLKARSLHIPCTIKDEFNEIILTDSKVQVSAKGYTHVSLLPLTPEVTGITLDGFLYPLHEAALIMGQSLGISNVPVAENAQIRIRTGLLLVIRSKD